MRDEKIIGALTNLYAGGLYSIKIEEAIYNFIEGEELIANSNQFLYFTKKEWNIIKSNLENKKNLESKNSFIKHNNKIKSKKKFIKYRKH